MSGELILEMTHVGETAGSWAVEIIRAFDKLDQHRLAELLAAAEAAQFFTRPEPVLDTDLSTLLFRLRMTHDGRSRELAIGEPNALPELERLLRAARACLRDRQVFKVAEMPDDVRAVLMAGLPSLERNDVQPPNVATAERREAEAYWSERLVARRASSASTHSGVGRDHASTEEVLAGEADTIFAEIQGRVGDATLAQKLAEVHRAIANDNVRYRARFLDEVEVLATPDAARHVSVDAATLDKWRAEHRVVGVPVGAAWLWPMFQFEEGAPKPVVARALAKLPTTRSPWEAAWWFVSSNSWLGGPAPVSVLDSEPDAVVWAAERENDKIGG